MRRAGLAGPSRTILLTGYSYYGRFMWNPTEEVVEMLRGRVYRGFRVEGLVLPVSLRRVRRVLLVKLEELSPAAVVGLGLSPRVTKLVVEMVSANLAYFEAPDIDGYRAQLEPVVEGWPSIARTSIPVEKVVEVCARRRGLPLRPGVSIGTYLCNAAGFIEMGWAERTGRIGGFVHVPPHTELSMRLGLGYSLPLSVIRESVECILEVVAEELEQREKPL